MTSTFGEPSSFIPLESAPSDKCGACGAAEKLGFKFDFAYQPIVDVVSRNNFAHEALVRGPAGEGALSVLSQVTQGNRYRFDQACRVKAIKTAVQLGVKEKLSINFLPNAVYKPEVCIRTTLEAARTHNFPIDHIIFEVTEGERVEDGPWLASILREYKRQGMLTAIDDFGAGYAGLTLLADFTPDFIKLDMALVRGIEGSKSRQAIARGMLRICQELGIQVIAEGIETANERDFFLHEGVRLMQGYLFARPSFRAITPVTPESWPA
ncbi:EAL domain-containing protein [Roseateles sp.]|uniref:EAL domain-containing protein n=1 Tax=Roseateles sp. TaxID=1971397 RepID=UPI00286ACAA5|nr:EAL domain-containing protein [Roseateles sp.]